MTQRAYNFNAGPSALPLEVLERAQQQLVNFRDSGMSIMEMSHRSAIFDEVHNEAIALLKKSFMLSQKTMKFCFFKEVPACSSQWYP